MNPYQQLVAETERLAREARGFPLGGIQPPARPSLPPGAPIAMIFAPHPDDECLIGGLPLRLRKEAGMRVVNVAVTQGSKRDRQAARLHELEGACAYLGFDLRTTAPGGLLNINARARAQAPDAWRQSANVIAGLLEAERPRVIFVPHEADWNGTHIGTHLLVLDALLALPPAFACWVVETEFWAAMPSPNLLVESSVEDVAELVAATSFHAGEVLRNPYHLRLPAWLADNVRRGGELVGGQGQAAPDFSFATLYRMRAFRERTFTPTGAQGRCLSAQDDIGALFPTA